MGRQSAPRMRLRHFSPLTRVNLDFDTRAHHTFRYAVINAQRHTDVSDTVLHSDNYVKTNTIKATSYFLYLIYIMNQFGKILLLANL